MSTGEIICLVLGGIVGLMYFFAHTRTEPPCSYTKWLRGVQLLNPHYKPPYVMGSQGKYVENPEFIPDQIIKHERP